MKQKEIERKFVTIGMKFSSLFSVILLITISCRRISCQRDTAALIIGGWDENEAQGSRVTNQVELFGCTGADPIAVEVNSFPGLDGITMTGSTYVDEMGGYVLICGGVECIDTNCTARLDCHRYDGGADNYMLDAPLLEERAVFHMAMIENQNLDPPSTRVNIS